MKIFVCMKTPDAFDDAVDTAVREEVNAIENLDEEEKEGVIKARTRKVWEALEKFVGYKEYVNLTFDTEAGTAVVEPRKHG